VAKKRKGMQKGEGEELQEAEAGKKYIKAYGNNRERGGGEGMHGAKIPSPHPRDQRSCCLEISPGMGRVLYN
jgi:hypothetical protein